MMSFKGQPSWAKMTSPGGKLTALTCHLTKKVTQAEELTYLSTNIGSNLRWNVWLPEWNALFCSGPNKFYKTGARAASGRGRWRCWTGSSSSCRCSSTTRAKTGIIGRNATLAADTIFLVSLYIYHSVLQFVLLQNSTTLSECFNLYHHASVYLSL